MSEAGGDGDDLSLGIERRVEQLNRDRAWDHLKPGARTAGLDDAGNVVEVWVDADGNTTEHPVQKQP